MAYKDFYEHVKNKKFDNIYILYGIEKYLIDSMLEHAQNILLASDFVEFNKTVLDGKELEYSDLMNSISTLPVMSEYRIVIINEADFIKKSIFSTKQEKEFLNYFSSKKKIHTKLFIINSEIDKRKSIIKKIAKIGSVIEFTKLDERELRLWISREFKNRDVTINSAVLNSFVQGSGYYNDDFRIDLYSISNSIKAFSSRFRGAEITKEAVEEEFDLSAKSNIFQMLDFLFSRNSKMTYYNYNLLKSAGEHDIKILYMIGMQLRNIIKVKKMQEFGYSWEYILKNLNLKPYSLNKYIAQSKNYEMDKLIYILSKVVEVDNMIKLEGKEHEHAMSLLINSILIA